MHKIGGAHPQRVNDHYEKFKYKGIKTFEVTDLHILGTLKL